ncbi:hypothetical protein BH18ACT3_BH18ACT3_02030 [soil metagenome]
MTVAVAAPTDVLGHSEPRRLERLADTAAELFDDAASQRWSKLEATVGRMTATWDRYHRDVPPLLEGQMTDALDALQSAVDNRDRDELRQAVINVGHAVHDIDLQFESPDRSTRIESTSGTSSCGSIGLRTMSPASPVTARFSERLPIGSGVTMTD